MINGGPISLYIRALAVFIFFTDLVEIFCAVFFVIVDREGSIKIDIINAHNALMYLIYVFILVFVVSHGVSVM